MAKKSASKSNSTRNRARSAEASAEFLTSMVLPLYFHTLVTLREYFIIKLSSLPPSSNKQNNLHQLGFENDEDEQLNQLLDTALVGLKNNNALEKHFSKRLNEEIGPAASAKLASASCSQAEIVELAVKTLFLRAKPSIPSNVLTLGFFYNNQPRLETNIANGIVARSPNTHVTTLKSLHWQRLLKIVREEVMLDLLLNTSVFVALENNCYYQLLGPPISELEVSKLGVVGKGKLKGAGCKRSGPDVDAPAGKRQKFSKTDEDIRSLSEITFVRSRMFYSRPAHNTRGEVVFGLRHIHVLNRYPDYKSKEQTVHVLQYIFPRQFGLHNVFTCNVDRRETTQRFKDYTVREYEIAGLKTKSARQSITVPRRLKGKALDLCSKLQRLQWWCPYHALVKYYCPASLCDEGVPDKRIHIPARTQMNFETSTPISQLHGQRGQGWPKAFSASRSAVTNSTEVHSMARKECFTDHATPVGDVAAFVKAVVKHVFPKQFFGSSRNCNCILLSVDKFLKLRRYENLSLHQVLHGLKLREFLWLVPDGTNPQKKLAQSDKNKRTQLLSEFIYWFFDSFIIPLIQSHFYVTESNANRQSLYYFRHDVWRKLSEPELTRLKCGTLEEVPLNRAKRILESRELGCAQVRLLPKDTGARPIVNLRRREMNKSDRKHLLKPSMNNSLKPLLNVLMFEKARKSDCLGASMFSVNEMYPRLRDFKLKLREKGWLDKQLYFVKVDIKACFDTIPQKKLLEVVEKLITEDEYQFHSFTEVRAINPEPNGAVNFFCANEKPWIFKKYIQEAKHPENFEKFEEMTKRRSTAGKKGTIFIDKVYNKYQSRESLMDLLEEHVQQNLIKIGKKIYRQKSGIPQGSVLSTILCNLFYGDLERRCVSFVFDEDGLLLRQIDDFLFITINRENASRFLQIMYTGIPDYGAYVGPDKALVNFETSVDGKKINRLVGTLEFPFCGNTIHTKNLDIKKDLKRRLDINIRNSVTIKLEKNAGRQFERNVIRALKTNAHPMFFDPKHNSPRTVLTNFYRNFVETAMKFFRLAKSLMAQKRPTEVFFKKIITNLFEIAFRLLRNRQNQAKAINSITKSQVKWLGASAFRKILGKKQTIYHKVLAWLDHVCAQEEMPDFCQGIVRSGDAYVFSRQY